MSSFALWMKGSLFKGDATPAFDLWMEGTTGQVNFFDDLFNLYCQSTSKRPHTLVNTLTTKHIIQ